MHGNICGNTVYTGMNINAIDHRFIVGIFFYFVIIEKSIRFGGVLLSNRVFRHL